MSTAPNAPGRLGRVLRRWSPRLSALLLLTIACYFGGVAATSLFPTAVQTRNYVAVVRLSALPTLTSTLHSPTSFGDIDLDFTSYLPAPGIDATVQVKENITDLFDDRRVSITSLQPSGEEVSRAVAQAVTGVGLKFAAGAAVVGLLTLGLVGFARHRPPNRIHTITTALAVALAVGGTGLASWVSYQPSHLTSFTTTSLLGTVRRNAGLLGDVEARAAQATPYIKNLLALSQALQEKFVPQDVNQPAAARFLLVSDLHGANQYPVMAGIIKDENITAVIDSGDLLNFGSVTEAEAAGIFTSIAKLGVPYIFVRGNHDAARPDDPALLARLARIPNVVLLQPNEDGYVEAGVNGITVAGFNDPRYFGDDSKNTAAKNQPAVDAFNRTFTDRDMPDLVVTHEPSAAKGVKSARIVVNGHLHSDELEGNRIGVGTFTGGGTVSHFIASPDGELEGQPYAFDIAVFGNNCALASLTRYTYRNLIEGRPAYDNVTVINGSTIETTPPAAKRTCGPDQPPSRTAVDLVPAP